MMVFKRRKGESIRIGNIVVTVLGTGPSECKLGIQAPIEVDVVRGEIDNPEGRKVTKEGEKP